jgi:hypothetical protein
MFTDVTRFVDFMIENQITERQFLLCFLLFHDMEIVDGRKYYESNKTIERPISSIYKLTNYYKNIHKTVAWTKEDIIDLENKGFIKVVGNKYSPDMLSLQDKFMSLLVSGNDFEEFWDTYPAFIPPFDGSKNKAYVKLKSVNKDQLAVKYQKYVTSKEMHYRVMDILKWSIENNQVSLSIANYVDNKYWFEDEKLREHFRNTNAKATVGISQKRA